MMEINKIWDILYSVDKERELIERIMVIGVYNLESVDTAEKYFFNSPIQLISTVALPSDKYSTDYNNKIQHLIDKWVYKSPIEKHSFYDIDEYSKYTFRTMKEAEEVLNITKEENTKKKERNIKIRDLELELEELRWY